MGQYIKPINNNYLNLSGGSVTGDTIFTQNLSAGTFISGSTNLYNIFQTVDSNLNKTYVQPGRNITTGGTIDNPIVNLLSSPSVNDFIASGNTSLVTVSATQLTLETKIVNQNNIILSGDVLFGGVW